MRSWSRSAARCPPAMPRPRRTAEGALASGGWQSAGSLDTSPRPAARPCLPPACLPWGPCVKLFFPPPVRRGPAEDTVSLPTARAPPTDAPTHGSHERRLARRATVLWPPPRALCGRIAQCRRRLHVAAARTQLAPRCLSMARADAAVRGPHRTGRDAQNFHDAGEIPKSRNKNNRDQNQNNSSSKL